MNINNFYSPTKDATGRVYLMKYCNSGLSYAVSNPAIENKFFLCSSPVLSSEVIEIISEHESFEAMRHAFFQTK